MLEDFPGWCFEDWQFCIESEENPAEITGWIRKDILNENLGEILDEVDGKIAGSIISGEIWTCLKKNSKKKLGGISDGMLFVIILKKIPGYILEGI